MFQYTISQWVLFFFFYCFVGWIWESCYVSVRKKRWVNRGFLHGPSLPIYGTGAICVLLCTMGVRDNLILIFVFGMTGATILEYFTGAGMEKLFRVRYWDYSNNKFNLNGHICLGVSIGWGFFSLLLVKLVHPPVETGILWIPPFIAEILSILLTLIFAVDLTQSFNEAMDLKETLETLSESNQTIRRLQKRLEVVTAIVEDELQQYQKTQEQKRLSRKDAFEQALEEQRSRRRMLLKMLAEKVNELAVLDKKEELLKLKGQIEQEFKNMGMRTTKSYKRAFRILHRNPTAFSHKYAEELKQIRDLLERKSGRD